MASITTGVTSVLPVLSTILAVFVSAWYFQLMKKKPWHLSSTKFEASSVVEQKFQLHGGFVLSWEQEQLTLHDAADKLIWSTISGQAFLGLGQINSKSAVHYFFGFEVLEPTYARTSTRQSITEMVQDTADASVHIKGVIFCDNSEIPYELVISADTSSGRVQMNIQTTSTPGKTLALNRLVLEYESPREEIIFGFGQQFPRELDFKGKRIPIIVNEQGLGRGLQPLTWIANTFHDFAGGTEFSTYAPMPHYMTSTGRSMFIENYDYTVFDLRQRDRVKIEISCLNMQFQVFGAAHPLDLIEKFTEFTGRMKPLPDWFSSGAIVGTQGGRAFVEDLHEKLHQAHVPVAGYWLQDWVGNRVAPWGVALVWNWEADETKYPRWKEFIQEMNAKGVRILSYINSHVGDVATEAHPVKRNLYQELVDGDMAVRDHDGNVQLSYQKAAMFDLTNPKTRAWVKALIRDNFLQDNVSGWMNDFGEALQLDAQLFKGNAAEFHNRYPEEWAKVNSEAVSEAQKQDDIVYFMRAASLKSPQYTPLFWLGDQLQSWDRYDGFKSVVFAATVGGFSGIALTHADIGGYNYINQFGFKYCRTKELFFRSCEFSAFTAAYRTHDGTNKEKAWQLYSDQETIEFFGKMAKVFVAWKFYRTTLMQETAAKGYPLIRHMYLNFPNDPVVLGLKYQFMLGTELLVAPVVDEGHQSVSVYIPTGVWIHAWTDRVFQGPGFIEIEAAYGSPCVLYPQKSTVGEMFVQNLIDAKVRV